MHIIEAKSINEALIKCAKLINEKGIESVSRSNQGTDACNIQVYNTKLKITNPRDRFLNVPGRKNNIFAMIAETFWTLAGQDEINPYLSFYLPRAKDFSDDGIKWRAAYGPRIFKFDQIQGVIDQLTKNPLSRQAVISIYDSGLDSPSTLPNGTRDIPCNNLLYFFSTADDPDKINLTVTQRSGDLIWGMGSINIFLWTILQEIVANSLNKEVGFYVHDINNMHVYKSYDVAYNQYLKILENPSIQPENKVKSIFGFENKSSEFIKNFFLEIFNMFSDYIIGELTPSQLICRIENCLWFNKIPKSTLRDMIICQYYYTVNKKMKANIIDLRDFNIDKSSSLYKCVQDSSFTNFENL